MTDEFDTLNELPESVDLLALYRSAVRASIDAVQQIDSSRDLSRPTPCAAWTLHGLLAHMVTQHHGFAAASRGGTSISDWLLVGLGPDPVAEYRSAAEDLLAEFARGDVLGREFVLAEFKARQHFSGAQAVSFHFIDYVVHAWDVARSLGTTVTFDPEVIKAALIVAKAVPGGSARTRPGAAFAPALSGPIGGLDEILATLGRSPHWPQ